MNKTERILLGATLLVLAVMVLVVNFQTKLNIVRVSDMEVRLQNMEHLLSLSASESRSSVPIGPTNGLPAFAPAPRERVDSEIKRRAQRKSGHHSSAHDRRTEGQ